MDKEIVWRKKARDKFIIIIEYLQKEWSERTVEEFINKVEKKVELLKSFPKIGMKSEKRKGLRKLILSSQNMLVYRIKEHRIILLDIYDTRQDPIKIDY